MPFLNEHSGRVRKPEDFEGAFRRENIELGVDTISGKLKGEETYTVQSYRFDLSKFTSNEAENWLKNKNIEILEFEPAKNEQLAEGHIFVYGEIIPWQDEDAKKFGGVNLKDIVNQIGNNKDANRLVVHIHSPGGSVWEGFAIHDALVNSGKEIETIIEGLCASIATVIALAGDKRLMTQHSEFMIHNPWTVGIGDSEDLKKQSEELAKTENKLAEFYAAKTILSTQELLDYMHNETFFEAEEAKKFGFITEVVNTMKQVASIKNKPKFNNSMNKEQEEKLSLLDKFFNKIEKLFQKNITLTDVNGTEMDFPECNDPSEVKVGVKVNIAGAPANEEHKMPSGETYVCEAGVLKEIKPKEETTDDNQALKDENASLKSEVEKLKGEKASLENKLKTAETETSEAVKQFKEFKAQFSNGNTGDNEPPAGDPDPKNTIRKPFKTKE
jgi:ATP-dependent Clp endopeptidase proteolytic subunit ClpP